MTHAKIMDMTIHQRQRFAHDDFYFSFGDTICALCLFYTIKFHFGFVFIKKTQAHYFVAPYFAKWQNCVLNVAREFSE